jgi:hypothetical protein
MLTITDLHNEQELSSFEMGKVVGGNDMSSSSSNLRPQVQLLTNPDPLTNVQQGPDYTLDRGGL